MSTCKILSVQLSEKKGVQKTPVPLIELDNFGVKGDAHAGDWHRQVSMLGIESIRRFEEKLKRKIDFGEFAENITTEGMELFHCMPLDRFTIGEIELQVTQIGKKCHGDNCAIFQEVGTCVMPKEGIFCKVIKPGILKKDDVLEYHPYKLKGKVITLSDRASNGEYEDLSGPFLKKSLENFFLSKQRTVEVNYVCIPDDGVKLKEEIYQAIDENVDYIFTTGGTGIGPRDITPDIIKPMLEKELPGIMELIRVKYGMDKPQVLLSRSVAGVIKNSLVFTLPGSVKGVKEYFDEISKNMEHAFFMMKGIDIH